MAGRRPGGWIREALRFGAALGVLAVWAVLSIIDAASKDYQVDAAAYPLIFAAGVYLFGVAVKRTVDKVKNGNGNGHHEGES